ncbi:MAG: proteasome ATPase [Schaalia georgiae]|uniref:AAA ATPase forming ring-shaped complexes n=1 Tax=Schaalia georgiae TaxID=52768 RepID=A0A929MY94_9ACTO|nr:proteasome ATPase [Schaalia georgiae]
MTDGADTARLQRQVVSLTEKNARLTAALTRTRSELVRIKAELADVNRPPQSLATFLRADDRERQIEVFTGGRIMRVAASLRLDVAGLSYGQRVRLDDQMVAVAASDYPRSGTVVSVLELVGDDRVLVSSEGGAEQMLVLAGPLRHGNLRPGDSLVADTRTGTALERIVREDVEQLLAPEVPDTSYDDIGGLDAQIQQVRDAVELPFTHPELFGDYGLRPPKGILLYGPPGSGKTLIAKAVANSLSRGRDGAQTYFLSIKGPELLNKFVGETERQIRAIFARARALAASDTPVVVFFDEMEALFRTRGTGVSSDVETMIVPQLLAEMDGVESLDNVVIIGASNRADMIDPAVLRPGRLDVRIRVDRPDRAGALDIFSKYLTPSVPIRRDEVERHGGVGAAVERMREAAVERLYVNDETTALFVAALASGGTRRIYLSDLVSGALIAGVVERAKKHAIKDALGGGAPGLGMDHLMEGLAEEMRESLELAATASPQDWARTSGLGAEIVGVKPIGVRE